MAVPKLKFKADDGSEFPEWEEKCIDTEFDFYNGVAHENNVVEKGKYIVVNSKFISSDGKIKKYSDVANFPLMIDDIVMVMSDVPNGKAIAKCFLIDKNDTYTLNQRICCLRTKHNAIFMLNQINRNNYFLRFDDGIKQTNLRKEDILRCPIYVPSVLEQQKMAEFLYTIDEIIQSTESELTAWQERKKGVMQKIFNREVRFKADDGSEFPEWEEAEIGEVGTFIKGAALSKADISNTGTPFVLYGELYTTYKEIAYTIKRKTEAVVDEKYYSKIGDVAIPTSGESPEEISTATCIMVPNVILAGDLNIFRSSIIDGRIMSYILNYQAKNKIATIAQGKSIVHIQAKELSKIKIKFPIDVNEQCKIAECLSSIDDVISNIQAELSALKEFKKGLLQQMFV